MATLAKPTTATANEIRAAEADGQYRSFDWYQRGARPVVADSVAVFRMGFGLLVAYSATRFLLRGWVDDLYLAPTHHLTYEHFEWVRPLPAPWMHLWVAGVAVSGIAIALGWHFRIAVATFIVMFGYTELIEASLYLNHYWFLTVTAVLILLLPMQHRWSLDARADRVVAATTVPIGVVWALRAQLGVVYLFAGIAKLNPDWLLRGQPLRLWFADSTHLPVVGPLLAFTETAMVASWAGAFFDCTIVGWLLWKRSRPLAYLVLVGFHVATGVLFQIGVFPLVMIVLTLIFFEPDWPRRIAQRFGFLAPVEPNPSALRHLVVAMPRWRVVALVLFAVAQVVVPLRHYTRDGNVRWNEDGYYLSWRVMLTDKAGTVSYRVRDADTGDEWTVPPTRVLTDWQANHAATRPDLIHHTALLIAEQHAQRHGTRVEVRVEAWVSMNAQPVQQMIDPTVDLAAHQRGDLPSGTVWSP